MYMKVIKAGFIWQNIIRAMACIITFTLNWPVLTSKQSNIHSWGMLCSLIETLLYATKSHEPNLTLVIIRGNY